MNRHQKTRLFWLLLLLALLSSALALVLYALKQNINLFYTPTQLAACATPPQQILRVGGYVKKQSVHFDTQGTAVHFMLMDPQEAIEVTYHGVLPSLFREGQGVVVTGRLLDSKHFSAAEVLAKHDEKYVPRYLAEELASPKVRSSK